MVVQPQLLTLTILRDGRFDHHFTYKKTSTERIDAQGHTATKVVEP